MRYFYRDHDRRRVGPFTWDELRDLHFQGVVRPDTELVPEDGFEVIYFRDLWAGISGAPPPNNVPPPWPRGFGEEEAREVPPEGLAEKAGADLKALIPHLLIPFEELSGFRWLSNKRMIAIAAIGLMPLILITVFAGRGNVQGAFWAVAFYFSALWGLFFHYAFPAPGVRLYTSMGCFFGTGFISVTILLVLYSIPPLSLVPRLLQVENLLVQMGAFVFGVGLMEEGCKMLALFYVLFRLGPQPPQTMLFYGLMSGLGFGIYEGVGYQLGRNIMFSQGSGEYYYLLNLIRLTSLPFLHAMWTGIAGYFIGFASQYPERRHGLWVVAIGMPAVLHGLYNTFSSTILGFVFALLSVLALNLYLAKSVDFERALRRRT